MEPRRLLLGTIVLDGDKASFVDAEEPILARVNEPVELIVRFDYHEPSEDKDEAFIVFSAELEGRKLGRAEERIEDRPLLNDDERGYLSVAIPARARGKHEGTFRIEARTTRQPWGGGEVEEHVFVVEEPFTLVVE